MLPVKKLVSLSLLSLIGLASVAEANDLARRAVRFDGVDDLVRVPFKETLALTEAMTAEAWIRPSETDEGGLISMWGAGLDPDKFILALGNNQLIARIELDSGTGVQIASPLATDAWTHVAMTYDGLSLALYINGSMVNIAGAPGALADNDLDLRLGIDDISPTSTPAFYHGDMDEVRIWRYARTPNQMASFYNQIINPETDGMVAYLQMNGAVGDQVVRDSSPFGNEGTLGFDANLDTDDPQRDAVTFGGLRWANLLGGLDGVRGTPFLHGTGTLQGGSPTILSLQDANPLSDVILVMGATRLDAPLLGGTLIPLPQIIIGGLITNAMGELTIIGPWPNGVPSCQDFYFQMWTVDPAGPQGYSASNGMVAETAN